MSVASQQIYEFLGVPAIFSSDAMERVLSLAERVARSNAAVLITGESGSGKEVIARAIHHFSPRSKQSWVDLNCAALPEIFWKASSSATKKAPSAAPNRASKGCLRSHPAERCFWMKSATWIRGCR